ncbi:hypothetical protein M409DRAFT_28265 [Zasmidium cellare ATCC 36951]|uniref:Uncharacterized protein n=1 Tax=Zasmidium cellare ATCC 36951 TaxID=1080233 RepID=A0A6A6C780_ZASCE|nr:uncharacterized protein M409DRAFT_28265 [Zasmidium cellare ATCC 36951]KAF2161226.1 hypothetical protein M409DRAFT_28265 [Zasmidium cellare ATCC 36951]
MHLRSVYRSSHYAAKPSPTLVRRDGSKNLGDAVAGIGIFLAVIFGIACGIILIRHIVGKVKNKKHRAQGQGNHLQSGSLRRHRRTSTSAFNKRSKMDHSSIHSDWRDTSNLTPPQSAHAASMAFSQSGHPCMPPYPTYSNDGFEPTAWGSRTPSPFVIEDLPAARRHPRCSWI